ncbi:MAG: hypothetical protein Q7R94_00490 [bacterium]|nr:hypothetical protein [bacterium]
MKRVVIFAAILVLAILIAAIWLGKEVKIVSEIKPPWIGYAFTGENEYSISKRVEAGKTFAQIAESFGMGYDNMLGLLRAAKDFYNIEKIE